MHSAIVMDFYANQQIRKDRVINYDLIVFKAIVQQVVYKLIN